MLLITQSLLTDKQKEFLLLNDLSCINEDSQTYVFIKELFDVESLNTPIKEPIFFYTIFEFINLYLYLFNPSQLIPTLNRKPNLDHIKILLDKINGSFILNDPDNIFTSKKGFTVEIKYVINAHKRRVKIEISLGDNIFTWTEPFNLYTNILTNKVVYEVDNANNFLFKVVDIYNEFIEIMPNEELDFA